MAKISFHQILYSIDDEINSTHHARAEVRTVGERWTADARIESQAIGDHSSSIEARVKLIKVLRQLANVIERDANGQ